MDSKDFSVRKKIEPSEIATTWNHLSQHYSHNLILDLTLLAQGLTLSNTWVEDTHSIREAIMDIINYFYICPTLQELHTWDIARLLIKYCILPSSDGTSPPNPRGFQKNSGKGAQKL